MKCPELSKEFGDVFRFLLTSIPTAAEAAEVDARADRRSPGRILPYRGKSVAREIQNSKSRVRRVHVPEPQTQLLVEVLIQHIKIVHENIYKAKEAIISVENGECDFEFLNFALRRTLRGRAESRATSSPAPW